MVMMIRVWSAGVIFLPLLLVRVGESRRRRSRCCVKGCEHQGEDGLRFHTLIVAFPFVFWSNGSLLLLLLLLLHFCCGFLSRGILGKN